MATPLISLSFLVCCSCIYVQFGKMNEPLSGLTKRILQHALYGCLSHPVTPLVAVFLPAEKNSNILLDWALVLQYTTLLLFLAPIDRAIHLSPCVLSSTIILYHFVARCYASNFVIDTHISQILMLKQHDFM